MLLITIIRQPSLYDVQELYDIEPTQKYEEIISTINLGKVHHAVTKKSCLGSPEELNYAAMIISIVVRYVERIPAIKDLFKLLHNDLAFKLDCGFLVCDSVAQGSSERFPQLHIRHQTMDAGYDYEPIYEQVHRMGQQSVIAYNRRNEGEPIGFGNFFAPTCFREHSYRYDSFDAKYETLKYTNPKERSECPLVNEGICQKFIK